MITKNIYEMPYPSAIPVNMDEVKDYVDSLASWLAEKLGLVVRSDLAVETPDYATNSYVTFIAPDAEADPYLAIYNTTNSSYKYQNYCIAPVKKTNNYFRPISVYNTWTNNPYWTRTDSNLVVNISSLGVSYKNALAVIDFNDNRKIGCFRCITVSTGDLYLPTEQGSIYLGKIIMRGNEVDTCVMFARGANSAWIEDYEQCAHSAEVTVMPVMGKLYAYSTYFDNAGLTFGAGFGKDFLMKLNYYIGADAYIPNFVHYSDYNNQLTNGSVVTINSKKYACIYHEHNDAARILMPEVIDG